ncbi:MAG: PQQ-binding-like beta-propeller repeat protein [Verrucomicrobiales bacterium]
MKYLINFVLTCVLTSFAVAQEDWPRWRGPDLSDHSPDKGLLKKWPKDGPKQVWLYKDAGIGYSGPAISNGKFITMGERNGAIHVIAIDTKNGKEIWNTKFAKGFKNNWGNGPRGTPTIDGDKVYALAPKGELICLNIKNGSKLWNADLVKNFGGKAPYWGFSESVLVHGNNVVVTPGGAKGAIVALNKITGKQIWQSKEIKDGAQYSSIIPIKHNGDDQYVQLFMKSLVGVSASDGSLLWKTDWNGRTAVIPTPIYKNGNIYISSGYNVGCKLINLSQDNKVSEVYNNDTIINHHGGVILIGEHLYGHSDRGGWKCQNFETGEEIWRSKELGKGAIHYADGMLYCLGESDGTVTLVKANTKGWEETGRFKLSPQTKLRKPSGKIWTHPVVIGGNLYLRDQEIVYCYKVKA